MDEAGDRRMTPVKLTHDHDQNDFFKINRKLLPIKGYYFCMLAAVGSLLPFLTIYLKQLNLTAEETGIMYGSMPFLSFFIRPIICAVADRLRKHRLTLMLCSVLCGVFFLLVLTVPGRVKPVLSIHSELNCNSMTSYFRDCVSQEESRSQQRTCHFGFSVLEDRLLNLTKLNESDVDCEVTCSKSEASVSEDFEVCITNSSEDFVRHCDGVHIKTLSAITFQLQNLSHVFNSEIGGQNFIKPLNCRDYDIKYLQYNSTQYWRLLCDLEGTLHCEIKCRNISTQLCQSEESKLEFNSTFGWLFLILLLANMFFAPVFSLADAATFDNLGEGNAHKFGEQRLWGTVGFALLAITSTFIMYILSEHGSSLDYSICFYIFVVLCCLSAAVAYCIDLSSNVRCSNFITNVVAVLKGPEMIVFLLVVMFFGMANGALESFLFWFLQDLGASPIVFGFCLVINCVFEVPLLFASGFIMKAVGPVVCLYLVFVAVAIRFMCYSLIVNPWLVLLIEPLNGITFGVMWPAATTKAAGMAPTGMSATIQGLVGGIYFGIGKGIGSILTGIQINNIGARWTFRIVSFSAVAFLLIYILLNRLCFRHVMSHAVPQQDKQDDQSSSINNEPLLLGDGETSLDRNIDRMDSPPSKKLSSNNKHRPS